MRFREQHHCAECRLLKRSIQPGDVVMYTGEHSGHFEPRQVYIVRHTSADLFDRSVVTSIVVEGPDGKAVGGSNAEWGTQNFVVVGSVL